MADDTMQLIEHLGFDKVHILGSSMGGMIAQQLAIDNPTRVASLVLACTTHGGKNALPAEKSTARSFFGSFKNWDEGSSAQADCAKNYFRIGLGVSRGQVSRTPKLSKSFLWGARRTSAGINAQLSALNWGNEEGLAQIQHIPTLVIHGDEDRVVPYGNSERILAKLGENARLMRLSEAGHFWQITEEGALHAIDDFLVDAESGTLAHAYVAPANLPDAVVN